MSFASYAFDGQEKAPDNQINLIENTTSMSENYAPTFKIRVRHRHVTWYDENGKITDQYDEYWLEIIW